jgi:hypothetical protein
MFTEACELTLCRIKEIKSAMTLILETPHFLETGTKYPHSLHRLLLDKQNNGWSFVSDGYFADELDHPNLFSIKTAK